jgi:hypothetical protein
MTAEDSHAIACRIDVYLAAVEDRLAIFHDGIENWDERLPQFRGTPRRWPLDDQHAATVGDALLSRYGGYDWWVIEEMIKPNRSLDRAYLRSRMNDGQRERYLRCLSMVKCLRPIAMELGLVFDWRRHAIAPRLLERCPDHPSVRFIRNAEQLLDP